MALSAMRAGPLRNREKQGRRPDAIRTSMGWNIAICVQ